MYCRVSWPGSNCSKSTVVAVGSGIGSPAFALFVQVELDGFAHIGARVVDGVAE
jgi:hypothetical protein